MDNPFPNRLPKPSQEMLVFELLVGLMAIAAGPADHKEPAGHLYNRVRKDLLEYGEGAFLARIAGQK